MKKIKFKGIILPGLTAIAVFGLVVYFSPNTEREISAPIPVFVQTNSGDYTKDKNYVYFRGGKLEGIDPDSLVFIRGDQYRSYVKDKNAVYFNGQAIPEADPATFSALGGSAEDQYATYDGMERTEK